MAVIVPLAMEEADYLLKKRVRLDYSAPGMLRDGLRGLDNGALWNQPMMAALGIAAEDAALAPKPFGLMFPICKSKKTERPLNLWRQSRISSFAQVAFNLNLIELNWTRLKRKSIGFTADVPCGNMSMIIHGRASENTGSNFYPVASHTAKPHC